MFFRLYVIRFTDIYHDYEGLTCEQAPVNNRKYGAHVTEGGTRPRLNLYMVHKTLTMMSPPQLLYHPKEFHFLSLIQPVCMPGLTPDPASVCGRFDPLIQHPPAAGSTTDPASVCDRFSPLIQPPPVSGSTSA